MAHAPGEGPPKLNPLTAEHYAGILRVHESLPIIEDAIARLAHIFENHPTIGSLASQHEMQKAVVSRLYEKYPPATAAHNEA